MASCVVCERKTSGSLNFCRDHYKQYQDDITQKKPWVKALKNETQRERRRQERERNDTSLDGLMDRQYERDPW